MFKCAMLGCGGRAAGHADAYQHVKRGKLVAVCDMNAERLSKLGDRFKIEKRYKDYEEMLTREKPDVLHIVTPPTIRHSVMAIADKHKVPAVIIEKPIATQGEDWRQLLALSKTSKTKYVVNTQLNFHPRNLDLKKTVANGDIGEVKFIDGSARSTPIDQGPHVLQLISSYINNSRPKKVYGQITVGKELESVQPSPDHATASITYENGVRAMVNFGEEAAPKGCDNNVRYMHKRVAVFGTKGYVHWKMTGWERFTVKGGYESGLHDYGAEDVLAQAGMTEATFDWIEDEKKVHPTHLAQSLAEFNLLMAIYSSGMSHKPLELPYDPPDGLLASLKTLLK
jgi:predicted dehydrogenase